MVISINERIWRNSCVNNAAVLLADLYTTEWVEQNKSLIAFEVLELAQELDVKCRSWVQGEKE